MGCYKETCVCDEVNKMEDDLIIVVSLHKENKK